MEGLWVAHVCAGSEALLAGGRARQAGFEASAWPRPPGLTGASEQAAQAGPEDPATLD